MHGSQRVRDVRTLHNDPLHHLPSLLLLFSEAGSRPHPCLLRVLREKTHNESETTEASYLVPRGTKLSSTKLSGTKLFGTKLYGTNYLVLVLNYLVPSYLVPHSVL